MDAINCRKRKKFLLKSQDLSRNFCFLTKHLVRKVLKVLSISFFMKGKKNTEKHLNVLSSGNQIECGNDILNGIITH